MAHQLISICSMQLAKAMKHPNQYVLKQLISKEIIHLLIKFNFMHFSSVRFPKIVRLSTPASVKYSNFTFGRMDDFWIAGKSAINRSSGDQIMDPLIKVTKGTQDKTASTQLIPDINYNVLVQVFIGKTNPRYFALFTCFKEISKGIESGQLSTILYCTTIHIYEKAFYSLRVD